MSGELCTNQILKARKAHSRILQVAQKRGIQGDLAKALSVSNATVNRDLKQLETSIELLYLMGFKVEEEGTVFLPNEYIAYLEKFHEAAIEKGITPRYVFGDEE